MALSTVRDYASEFAAGRYDAMWALLAPAARAQWGSVAGMASYYRAKFAPVRLVDISLGMPQWDGGLLRIPLTLDLAWRRPGQEGVLSLLRNLNVTLTRTAQRWRIAGGGPLDPTAPVIPPLHVTPRTVHAPILMYHHISSVPPIAYSQVGLTVTDREFAAQLAYLVAHGYHTVLLTDLFNALYYGRPLPAHPVLLTFDDGYLDNYTDAFPLLRRYRMVGEFNIITGYPGITLGVNRYMTWRQIVEMAAAGMEMESHTIDHQDLGLLPDDHVVYELQFSRAMLQAHIHRAVQFLCYPSGEPFRHGARAAQARVLSLLPRYGYVGALLDPVVPGAAQDAQSPYELPRIRVSPGEPLATFAANLQL